ncbi:AAA family ATPase [Acidaminobacter hydrogenoformans]|nr:ATP-binding protein [Acidaminobacter hydrogenoformans]
MFIGRELELQELERRYEASGFQLFVLYGRRVGKTRLIQEFCKNKAALFHVSIQQEVNGALRAFSRDVLAALPSEVSAYIDHFNSWEEAFRYTAAQANGSNENTSAVKGELLSLNGHLLEEPMNLMKQEMREPALYNSIIEAVANGDSRQNEIATAVKKDARDITAYLKALIDLGILEKQQPVEETIRKRRFTGWQTSSIVSGPASCHPACPSSAWEWATMPGRM